MAIPAVVPEVEWWQDRMADGDQLVWHTGASAARLYAAAVAATALPRFEREYPGDRRPAEAILTARGYALGLVGNAVRDAVAVKLEPDADLDAVFAAAAAEAAVWRPARFATVFAARHVSRYAVGSVALSAERAYQRRLLSLYLPQTDWPQVWRTELVVTLAWAIVRNPMSPDPGPLGALADALEDAGVTGWLPPALRSPEVQALVCPGWWVLRSCHQLPTHDPNGREIV